MEFMNWTQCDVSVSTYSGPTLDCIFLLIQVTINWLLTFAGIFAVILIIFSGLKIIGSGGDPENVTSGKKTLTHAIIGLLIVLLAFFIVNLIAYATGVSCLNLMGFEACK